MEAKFDDEEVKKRRWLVSKDGQSTFMASGPAGYAVKIGSSQRFAARLTPTLRAPMTVGFDLTGSFAVARQVRSACGYSDP